MRRMLWKFNLLCLLAFMLGLALASTRPPLAAAPASTAPQMGSANYSLDWSVASGIHGGSSASANYTLNGTLGQMAASTSSASANYGECAGFECAFDWLRTFLPLVAR